MAPFPGDLFTATAFTLIGGLGVVAEFREVARAVDSTEWPEVAGEIEEAGVVSEIFLHALGFAPSVRYRYQIGDRRYVSDRISFGGTVSTSFRGIAERVAKRYQKNKAVTVRFCPTDPSVSVLEPGLHWTLWFTLLMLTLFTAFGISTLLNHFGPS